MPKIAKVYVNAHVRKKNGEGGADTLEDAGLKP